jgi:uncharacterized protein YjdB
MNFRLTGSIRSALLFSVILLTACGGGGGSGGSTPTSSSTSTSTAPSTLPSLTSIAITPSPGTIAKGQITHLTATGTYSDATTADITNQVGWTSANTGVATIVSTTGVVTGVEVGSTTMTAAASGVTSPAAVIYVTAAVVTGISISPATPTVAKGAPAIFTATATYSDGTTGNVSGSATWESSNTAVATLNATGIASTLAQGETTITASLNSFYTSTKLTVTAPVLATLAILPQSADVLVTGTQQFTASGTLTDGTVATLGALTWASSNTSVATIDATGLATGVASGKTNISASSSGITSNTVVVTVPSGAPAAMAGSAFAYFSKRATANTWTWLTTTDTSPITWTKTSTIKAYYPQFTPVGGTTISTDSASSSGVHIPTSWTVDQFEAGAWTTRMNNGVGVWQSAFVNLPATFTVGTTWVPTPGWSATVVAFNVTRTVPAGTFTDCLQVTMAGTSGVYAVNETIYYSILTGSIVESLVTFNSAAGTSTDTIQLQTGYIANP